MSAPLPPRTWARIKAFLDAGHTGQIVLEVKDGRVLAYRVTECGRERDLADTSIAESRQAMLG